MATPTLPIRMSRLSVAMIVRDEQDVLAGTIESVQQIADEILVLDTGSTDRTTVIAERLGATVGRIPWTDDFSAARNHLLAQVTGDWILLLDAGERLTADSAVELRTFVDREADPNKVYLVLVEVPPADLSGSSEQAALPRLVPNHPQLRFTGRVRETLLPSMEAIGLQVDRGPGRIVRHPREHLHELKARKARRDLKLIALETTQHGEQPPRLLIALGEAHWSLKDRAAARQAFVRALNCSRRGSTEMLRAYYGLLTTFEGDQDGRDQQLRVCLEALEVYPLDAQLLCAMGTYLQDRNRLDLAARAFQTAINHGRVDVETWHLREMPELAAACLNLVLQLQGKDDEARRVLEEALHRWQDSARLQRHLIDLHVKHGRKDKAMQLADEMPWDCQQRDSWRNAIRGACHAAKQEWLAALGFLQSAYVAGCRDPFCLRWLSVTLLANGQTEAAEPVLYEWLRMEPNNGEARKYLAASGDPEKAGDASRSQPAAEADASRRLRIDSGGTVPWGAPLERRTLDRTPSADSAADPPN